MERPTIPQKGIQQESVTLALAKKSSRPSSSGSTIQTLPLTHYGYMDQQEQGNQLLCRRLPSSSMSGTKSATQVASSLPAETPGCDQGSALFSTLAYQIAIYVLGMQEAVNNAMIADITLPTKSIEIQI